MSRDRPGPAAIECAIDVWGKRGPVPAIVPPAPRHTPKIDVERVRAAARILGKAQRVLIVTGGGAQDAAAEVTLLSSMLQAPVLATGEGEASWIPRPLQRDLAAGSRLVERRMPCSPSERAFSIR
jgi:acetolactate synthase-1/2/3 large subunit